jgi:hypothetical protein
VSAMRTVWSVVALRNTRHDGMVGRGKLQYHVDGADGITLTDAVGYVDAAAAERVRTGEREVCAWVIGTLPSGERGAVYRHLGKSTKAQPPATGAYVSYDRDAMGFVTRPDGAPWSGAATVTFTDRMRVA